MTIPDIDRVIMHLQTVNETLDAIDIDLGKIGNRIENQFKLADEILRRLEAINKELDKMYSEERGEVGAPDPLPALTVQAMQQRADYNRDNAATLFGDQLYFGCEGGGPDCRTCEMVNDPRSIVGAGWRRRDTRKLVVFTPYGWIDDPAVT